MGRGETIGGAGCDPQSGAFAARLISEAILPEGGFQPDMKPDGTCGEIRELPREEQRWIALALVDRVRSFPKGASGTDTHTRWLAAKSALKFLLQRRLPFTDSDLVEMLDTVLDTPLLDGEHRNPLSEISETLTDFAFRCEPSPQLTEAVAQLHKDLASRPKSSEVRKCAALLASVFDISGPFVLDPTDPWAHQATNDLDALPPEQVLAWSDLLIHCRGATGSKPSRKWLQAAAFWIPAKVDWEQFRELILKWIPLVDLPGDSQRIEVRFGRAYEYDIDPFQLSETNQDILKGLVWCCQLRCDRELIRALGGLCASAFGKLSGSGRLGNACIHVLRVIKSEEALAQLALLKVKVRNRSAQAQIAKALQAAAERQGVTAEELEEISVPTYGLTEVGALERPLGSFTARLVVGARAAEITWIGEDGKARKSVPASVKSDFPEEVKELKALGREIPKMLTAIRERIDGIYLQARSWSYAVWRQRYLDHPLVGQLARRLVWSFEEAGATRTGIFHEGRLVDCSGAPIDSAGPSDGDGGETRVRLWHPLDGELSEVLAWRNWLGEHLVQQPFKQAHREVYLLTEAEERTATYSNRFAAHILKQHQFNALCLARGWKNTLRLMVDDCYPPARKLLPQWGLRAEFWIEGIGDQYGVDSTEAGTYLCLATDQVRFYPSDVAQVTSHAGGGGYGPAGLDGTDEPLALREVPRLVFSEIMRDVDLFVGVASVGNDPAWSDGGPEGRHQTYWHSYSFGDLSATAETRKEILERLLPRLKIADRSRIKGKFLIVRGTHRTYKIHLGSGNILMEPGDEYLCIVPNSAERRGADKIFLPFEGDATMSIILSKALLLADDEKIKDHTILSQIRARR